MYQTFNEFNEILTFLPDCYSAPSNIDPTQMTSNLKAPENRTRLGLAQHG